jgi:hypothetical protein
MVPNSASSKNNDYVEKFSSLNTHHMYYLFIYFISSLFNDAVINSDYIASNYWFIVNT